MAHDCCSDQNQADTGHAHTLPGSYTCPMHPEVVSRQPGSCPKCHMKLVPAGHHAADAGHDHASMMATPEAAADFLRRFWTVTVLLIPLVITATPWAKAVIGQEELLKWLQFGIASLIFYLGRVFFQHAWHEIKAKQYGMMTLVSLGVGAGYLFSAVSTFLPQLETEFYLEISTLIWVLLFGHYLEAKSSTAAGDALQEVAKLLPQSAHLKTKQGWRDVPVSQLKVKQVVLVKAGEKVPADGKIIKGSASFDESHITGESKPVDLKKGSFVPAGSINLDGSVEIQLTRVGANSTIGQIEQLISQAQRTKPSAQRLADKAARWLTFSALTMALVSLIIWTVFAGQPLVFAATLAITVLVIACPHALGLAIPTVSTIATRLAVKNGMFIKDMSKIEVIKQADYVVFDKTGTLTFGNFTVTQTFPLSVDETTLLSVTAGLEQHSTHVIAQAVTKFVKQKNIPIPSAKEIKNLAGKGMQGKINHKLYLIGNQRLMREKKLWSEQVEKISHQINRAGKTPIFVAQGKQILGVLALSDQIKPESKPAIDQLHRLGLKVAMLTGDTQAAAQAVADELGIDQVFAQVLPQDKYKHIKQLQDQGHTVIMTGDGVNDAPALTQADVGVAIGAGTDVAIEAADVVLTQSNPQHVVKLIVLSRQVYRKMVQNLWWALGYNLLAIPAAAGLFLPWGFRLTPAVGALLMSLSSVIVVANAMTLRRTKLKVS